MREIIMKTTFGDLVACEGGDVELPEILVFLRNKDGHELMLCDITDQSIAGIEDAIRIAVYGSPKAEDYTDKFVITRNSVNDKAAFWQ